MRSCLSVNSLCGSGSWPSCEAALNVEVVRHARRVTSRQVSLHESCNTTCLKGSGQMAALDGFGDCIPEQSVCIRQHAAQGPSVAFAELTVR